MIIIKALIFLGGLNLIYAAKQSPRDPKILSLFNVVKFKNGECVSNSAISSSIVGGVVAPRFRAGTCFTLAECTSLGGSASGSCASGFGVCCVFFTSTCGSTVAQSNVYIRNPQFPASLPVTTTTCSFTVNKVTSEICSLRLDFEQFTIMGVSTITTDNLEGNCLDSFNINSLNSGQVVPTICGVNSGQHIYVDLGANVGDSAVLDFMFGGMVFNRNWEIKSSQINCLSVDRPPSGCLQYFNTPSGRITTFNFAGTDGHLENQMYSICIKQQSGFCCANYQACADQVGSFSLDNQKAAGAEVSFIDTQCTGDYVNIEGSSATCKNSNNLSNRYCGQFLNAIDGAKANGPICDCTSPFIVGIKTNAMADAQKDILSKGACLDYSLVAC